MLPLLPLLLPLLLVLLLLLLPLLLLPRLLCIASLTGNAHSGGE